MWVEGGVVVFEPGFVDTRDLQYPDLGPYRLSYEILIHSAYLREALTQMFPNETFWVRYVEEAEGLAQVAFCQALRLRSQRYRLEEWLWKSESRIYGRRHFRPGYDPAILPEAPGEGLLSGELVEEVRRFAKEAGYAVTRRQFEYRRDVHLFRVKWRTVPDRGRVRVCPWTAYRVCLTLKKDENLCNWLDLVQEEVSLGGRYMYSVKWPDGSMRTGEVQVDNESPLTFTR
jgi:hypothetical protein